VAGAARRAGVETQVLDLCLADNPQLALAECLARAQPELVGLSLRNTDDCFWPSAAWFVPQLQETMAAVRRLTDAPVVLGGSVSRSSPASLSSMLRPIYGIRGDGEQAVVDLYSAIRGQGNSSGFPG